MTIKEFIGTGFKFKTETHNRNIKEIQRILSLLNSKVDIGEVEFRRNCMFYMSKSKLSGICNHIELLEYIAELENKCRSFDKAYYTKTKNLKKAKSKKSIGSNEYSLDNLITNIDILRDYIANIPFANFSDNTNIYNVSKKLLGELMAAKRGISIMVTNSLK